VKLRLGTLPQRLLLKMSIKSTCCSFHQTLCKYKADGGVLMWAYGVIFRNWSEYLGSHTKEKKSVRKRREKPLVKSISCFFPSYFINILLVYVN
jgi:hypothetical protein